MLPAVNAPGLLIGITFYNRPVQPEWAISLANLVSSLPINTSWGFCLSKDQSIAEARNAIAECALTSKVKYLLFIDDDTAPPNFAVTRLMTILESNPNAAVAGGIYFTKTDPTQPVVGRKFGQGPSWDWKLGDVFECEVLGTGCMMIKTEVFNLLERPWFNEISEDNPTDNVINLKMTDDCYFLQKVLTAGYKVLADGGTLPLHWDVNTGKYFTVPQESYPVNAYTKALEDKKPVEKITFTPEEFAVKAPA